MAKKALLIDANALLHRAWHALPPMTNPQGKMVNAVYGFTTILIKILNSIRPDVLAVCWDTPEPTFRHIAMPTYKAQREEQPDAFYDQIPMTQKIVEVFGGTNISQPGFEADDLLGTLAVKLEKAGQEVIILTGDKDAFQLITDKVSVLAFKKGVSETVTYTPVTLVQITGLRPDQIVDYKAMRGDASDNIPGISGIGEKTATELLQKFDDLPHIIKAAHDPKSKIADGVRRKLLDGEQVAKDTLPIVRIKTDVKVDLKTTDLIRRPMDEQAVLSAFGEMGFKSLVSRALSPKAGSQASSGKEISRSEPTSAKKIKVKTDGFPGLRRTSPEDDKHELIVAKSEKDVSSFLDRAYAQKSLIVHVPEVVQTSLFAETPGLLLGLDDGLLEIPKAILDKDTVHQMLGKALSDPKLLKVGHGLKTFCHWASDRKLEVDGLSFDTELAAYLLAAGERGHDLKTLTAMFLKRVLDEVSPSQSIVAIRELVPVLRKELEDKHLISVLDRFELPLIGLLADMETAGIMIDKVYLKSLSNELHGVKTKLEKQMQDMAGEPFNPLSPKQLTHVLFETLKISVKGIKRGKTGISTAASELDKLHGVHPIIELIEQHRELSKLLSTYVDALPQQADAESRVHTTFNQAVTATGRLSSSDPNLQNIPVRTEIGRKVRRAFVAKDGYVLLSCDYSQIELRIMAALAKDKKMLEAFEHGEDIHTATAANIWNLDIKEVTKDQRRTAKAINFGLIFGQGPQGLARSADISFEEAREFIARYFDVFSGVREWMDMSKALAASQGYIETLFGRRRMLPEIHSPLHMVRAQAERMAINMPVQGTEADLMKLAMIEVAKQLPSISSDAKMLLQVHDELLFEVPIKEVKTVAEQVVDIMQHVEKIGCPIVVDAKQGKNWEEMTAIN